MAGNPYVNMSSDMYMSGSSNPDPENGEMVLSNSRAGSAVDLSGLAASSQGNKTATLQQQQQQQQQHHNNRVKIALSLYKVQQNIYLLDFQRVEGDAFGFMKLCALIITELKNLSAASRANPVNPPANPNPNPNS